MAQAMAVHGLADLTFLQRRLPDETAKFIVDFVGPPYKLLFSEEMKHYIRSSIADRKRFNIGRAYLITALLKDVSDVMFKGYFSHQGLDPMVHIRFPLMGEIAGLLMGSRKHDHIVGRRKRICSRSTYIDTPNR